MEFVAREGHRFLPLYRFDLETGAWAHRDDEDTDRRLSLEDALGATEVEASALSADERRERYRRCLDEASRLVAALPAEGSKPRRLDDEAGELQYFVLPDSGEDEVRQG